MLMGASNLDKFSCQFSLLWTEAKAIEEANMNPNATDSVYTISLDNLMGRAELTGMPMKVFFAWTTSPSGIVAVT